MMEPSPARRALPAAAAAAAGGVAAAVTVAAGWPAAAVGGLTVAAATTGAALVGRVRRTSRTRTPTPAESENVYALPLPWRDLVSDAVRWQKRFDVAMARGPASPHLVVLSERVATAVDECWAVARRGSELVQLVDHLDPGELHRREVLASDRLRQATATERANLQNTLTAIQAQQAVVARIRSVADQARDQLEMLTAELGRAVAEAIEAQVHQGGSGPIEDLSQTVDALVSHLQVLGRAMAEADAAERGEPPLGG